MREALQELRPAFKSGAAYDAQSLALLTQFLQSANKRLLLEPAREFTIEADMGLRHTQRVLITEKIGHQRHISAAPRRRRERAAGDCSNQHRGLVIH